MARSFTSGKFTSPSVLSHQDTMAASEGGLHSHIDTSLSSLHDGFQLLHSAPLKTRG